MDLAKPRRDAFRLCEIDRLRRCHQFECDDQVEPLRTHILGTGIQTQRVDWGRPTGVITDIDANELFFWPAFEMPAVEASGIAEPAK